MKTSSLVLLGLKCLLVCTLLSFPLCNGQLLLPQGNLKTYALTASSNNLSLYDVTVVNLHDKESSYA